MRPKHQYFNASTPRRAWLESGRSLRLPAPPPLFRRPLRPADPSATCRIGVVIDKNLETQIKDLYCCDASVFPSSLGAPVVWTVVSLGKRLSKHLDSRLK